MAKKKEEEPFVKFRKEMKAKGYPDTLIEAGVNRARGFLEGIRRYHTQRALDDSKKWIEKIYERFLGKKAEAMA